MTHNDNRKWLLYIPGGLFIAAGAVSVLVALTLPLYSAAQWLHNSTYRLDLAVAGAMALAVGLLFIGFIWRDLKSSSTVRGKVVLKYYGDESAIIGIVSGSSPEDVREFAVTPHDYERVAYGDQVAVAYSPFLRLVRRVEILPTGAELRAA